MEATEQCKKETPKERKATSHAQSVQPGLPASTSGGHRNQPRTTDKVPLQSLSQGSPKQRSGM